MACSEPEMTATAYVYLYQGVKGIRPRRETLQVGARYPPFAFQR